MTEHTFFRHLPDKREALFDSEAIVRAALTAAIVDAPAELGPLDTLLRAVRFFHPTLEDNRPCSKPRNEVISTTPALLRGGARVDFYREVGSGSVYRIEGDVR